MARNGTKSGGRKKGTPNKRTQDVQALVAKASRSPFETLAFISAGDAKKLGHGTTDEKTKTFTPAPIPLDLQLEAAKELAPYLAPKRKAIEHSTPTGPIVLKWPEEAP